MRENKLSLIKDELMSLPGLWIIRKNKSSASIAIRLLTKLELSKKQQAQVEEMKKLFNCVFEDNYEAYIAVQPEVEIRDEFNLTEEYRTIYVLTSITLNLVNAGMAGMASDILIKAANIKLDSEANLLLTALNVIKNNDLHGYFKDCLLWGCSMLLDLEDEDYICVDGLSIAVYDDGKGAE